MSNLFEKVSMMKNFSLLLICSTQLLAAVVGFNTPGTYLPPAAAGIPDSGYGDYSHVNGNAYTQVPFQPPANVPYPAPFFVSAGAAVPYPPPAVVPYPPHVGVPYYPAAGGVMPYSGIDPRMYAQQQQQIVQPYYFDGNRYQYYPSENLNHRQGFDISRHVDGQNPVQFSRATSQYRSFPTAEGKTAPSGNTLTRWRPAESTANNPQFGGIAFDTYADPFGGNMGSSTFSDSETYLNSQSQDSFYPSVNVQSVADVATRPSTNQGYNMRPQPPSLDAYSAGVPPGGYLGGVPDYGLVMPKQNSSPSSSAEVVGISDAQVRSLFYLWNDALATLDPDAVARRYARSSVLLPTVSDVPRTDYNSIRAYFVDFLQKKPQGVVLDSNVIQGNGWCMDVGIYEFVMQKTGDRVRARYTFVYVFEDGEWKISHHHSSVMPEAGGAAKSGAPNISDSEVRDLFYLWNDALATLNPDAVASRYAKTAVLLPTVNDVPRTEYNGIRAYFVEFLQKMPQGVILGSNVIKGDGWCMDAGIYEFTMGATGDKVRARYSFVYTFEDGEWKISHHHSSVMPEALLGH